MNDNGSTDNDLSVNSNSDARLLLVRPAGDDNNLTVNAALVNLNTFMATLANGDKTYAEFVGEAIQDMASLCCEFVKAEVEALDTLSEMYPDGIEIGPDSTEEQCMYIAILVRLSQLPPDLVMNMLASVLATTAIDLMAPGADLNGPNQSGE